MVTTAGLLGAGMGLFVQLYSNGVRKLPLMRRTFSPLVALLFLSRVVDIPSISPIG